MRLKGSILCLFLIGAMQPAVAKNLGTYGPVFKVGEESFLEVIQNRLKTMSEEGKMEKIQQELQEKASAKVARPTPLEGVTKARSSTKRIFDPTFVLKQTIKDLEGNLIALAGTSYNPLDHKSFGDPLIFIDGDDQDQVQWSISKKGKIILINGAPLELEKIYHRPFFFDQGGVLKEKLSIEEVPAIVRQEGKHLLIETIPVPSSEIRKTK